MGQSFTLSRATGTPTSLFHWVASFALLDFALVYPFWLVRFSRILIEVLGLRLFGLESH